MKYTVVLAYDPVERIYNVTVPSLPGCLTWGRTRREALSRVKEAIESYLDSLEEDGLPIPKDDVSAIRVVV